MSNVPIRLLLSMSAAAVATVALLAAFFMDYALSWSSLIAAWAVIAAVVLVSRAPSFRSRISQPFVENVLVLGRTELACAVIAELKKRSRYRVLDVADSGAPNRILTSSGSFLTLADPFRKGSVQPHRIVVALGERRGRVPTEALLQAKQKGIVIEDALDVYERLTGKLALDRLYPSHLIYSDELRRSPTQSAIQRVISVVLSAIGIVLTVPLLAAIALLVKLDSPGPVLFVQERSGKDGHQFLLLKFRTMHPDTTRASEWVRDNGDRITRVGRWLRKFRLDEVPQLFNVLLGDMNLIGPRPHPVSNYTLFMEHIPFYAFRSMVLPGITGWAQVRYGYANSLEEETEKMCYDLYYIKYASLWMDVQILLRTIKVVMLGQENKQASPDQVQAPKPDARPERRLDAA
jgi:exopolysaccharide biosynthesis polyprenyl glycosylphosphotransferase